ncbi:MAG: DsbA family protein [Pseudomonadota bacterium]
MRIFSRRAALSAFAALALAACGSASGNGAGASPADSGDGLPDMVLGDPDAPVTLVEYASITCPACLQFHETVMPTIKEDYVETGKVKFIFREFPTPPANVAVAGFAIARCAGADKYFDVLDDMFDAQPGILMAARSGAVRPALEEIASRHGIAPGEEFDACVNNSDIRADIADVILSSEEYQVASTPTLILQGRKVENSLQSRTAEGLSALIDLELEAIGIAEGEQ